MVTMQNHGDYAKPRYEEYEIEEEFEPERTTLRLPFEKIGDKKSAIKIGDKTIIAQRDRRKSIGRFMYFAYITYPLKTYFL